MASRNTFSFGNRVLHERNEADNVAEAPVPRSVNNSRNAMMSVSNYQLLEEFVCYCEAKKNNLQKDCLQGGNVSTSDDGVSAFRDDIKMYFGDQLPPNVINELWKLVIDSTHGKCWSCKLPAESLVLGVLHILSDSGQLINNNKENIGMAAAAVGTNLLPVGKEPSLHCSQQPHSRSGLIPADPMNFSTMANRENRIVQNNQTSVVVNNANVVVSHKPIPLAPGILHNRRSSVNVELLRSNGDDSCATTVRNAPKVHCHDQQCSHIACLSVHPQNSKEASDFVHGLQLNKPILDTPFVKLEANRMYHVANDRTISKRAKVDDPTTSKRAEGVILSDDRALPAINLCKDGFNSRDDVIRTGPGHRFPVSEDDVRYFNVICGLATSQWSWRSPDMPAGQFCSCGNIV